MIAATLNWGNLSGCGLRASIRGRMGMLRSLEMKRRSAGASLSRGFPALALLATLACGGSGPLPAGPTVGAPTPAPPTPAPPGPSLPFAVFDGVSGAPIGAGQVAVGSNPPLPFSAAFDATAGSRVVITASGYLRRDTTLSSPRIMLWPAADATEEEYVRRLVYVTAIDNVSERSLARLPFGAHEVALSAELDTPANRDVLGRAFARLREATGGAVNFVLGSASPLVRVSVDPSVAPFAGFTNWTSSGGYITSGTVRFVNAERVANEALVLHEFGHMIGLQHSNRGDDVMTSSARIGEFTTRERAAVAMMFQRAAGNRFPDTDSGFAFRSAGSDAAFSCGR